MTALRTVSCPLPCLLDCLLACLTLTSNRHLDCYRSSPSDESHCHLSLSPFLLLPYPPACLTVSDTLKSIGGETKLFRLGPTRLLPGRESSSFHLRLGRGVLQMPCSCGSCGLYWLIYRPRGDRRKELNLVLYPVVLLYLGHQQFPSQ